MGHTSQAAVVDLHRGCLLMDMHLLLPKILPGTDHSSQSSQCEVAGTVDDDMRTDPNLTYIEPR